MSLQSLLNSKIAYHGSIALIIHQEHAVYYAQKVYYHPGVLDLGVILTGYYSTPQRVQRLIKLGNCLSIGHYLTTPSALRYGRDFQNSAQFKQLPSKKKKHLIQGIEDGTISFQRDLKTRSEALSNSSLNQLINSVPQAKYIYYFDQSRWLFLVHHRFNNLRTVIDKILRKKAV